MGMGMGGPPPGMMGGPGMGPGPMGPAGMPFWNGNPDRNNNNFRYHIYIWISLWLLMRE